MIPKGMTPEQAAGKYAKIVETVKAKFAKHPPRAFAGEQVSHEIAKQWHKECDEKFDEPKPLSPTGDEPVAAANETKPRGIVTKAVEMPEGPAEVPVPAK